MDQPARPGPPRPAGSSASDGAKRVAEGTQTAPSPPRDRVRSPRGNQTSDEETRASGSAGDGDGRVASEDMARSDRTSFSHMEPSAGFAHVDGDIGGPGYNETQVDIVTVPCPGAHPLETWARDPFPNGYFDLPTAAELSGRPALKELAGKAVLTPALDRNLPKAAHVWVRQGIRKFADTARVALYRHRELTEETDLAVLADDLLEHVLLLRQGLRQSRPLFFIAHSIGGLVVKQAILRASQVDEYRDIWYNCHGATFFATPHHGSSYMSMPTLSKSIQELLHLQHVLPRPIANMLRLRHGPLLKLHEDFTDIASELRIWSFYETIDSQLSGSGAGSDWEDEVSFSAPLVSIKSSIIGVRQEQVFSLDSVHSHCASFGTENRRSMVAYLEDLAEAVAKADEISSRYMHSPLELAKEVKVELIGFYDDPDAETESAIRLYKTNYHLAEFLQKGPERCLAERLTKVPQRPGRKARRRRTPQSSPSGSKRGRAESSGGLGISPKVQKKLSSDDEAASSSSDLPKPMDASPDITVTRPSVGNGGQSLPANMMRTARRGLTVPALSSPGFHRPSSRGGEGSTVSEPALAEDTSPKSGKAVSDIRAVLDEPARSEAATRSRSDSLRIKASALQMQDPSAGFSRPDPRKRKFMWIHLPFTNPPWVKDIFTKLSQTHGQNFSRLFNNENWVSKHVQGRHSHSQPTFVKPACNFVAADSAPSPRPAPAGSSRAGTPAPAPNYLYLYLPYLHYDTYVSMIIRRNLIKRRLKHGRSRPTPKDIADLESLELRVVWRYLAYDPPLNARRTLDQFGYPSLQDTYARDDDQMLYKLTKQDGDDPVRRGLRRIRGRVGHGEHSAAKVAVDRPSVAALATAADSMAKEADKDAAKTDDESDYEMEDVDFKNGNVLMVDQLWLWAIDNTTLATFFPKRESRPMEGSLFQQADLRNSVYNELNGDLTGRTENALDLAAFIALHAVTVLLDRSSHPDLEVFRIFEEAIGMLTERMTSSLKMFRMQEFLMLHDADDGGDNRAESIRRRHVRENEKAERENRENTSAVLELRDMEDELSTLMRLFETQTNTIKAMKGFYASDELRHATTNGRAYLDEALQRLDEYKQQTTEMLKRVDTTRKDYEKLLEIAQRQAQVEEVRWSRWQAELASSQNLSVMIFTTFTVIFLPLTFFTGLFGMNTFEWGGGENTPLWRIGSIALPISAILVIGSLVAAFSARVQSGVHAAYRLARDVLRTGVRAVKGLEPESRRAAKALRRRARELGAAKARRKRDRGYDFWATVKRQRNSEYQIPDLNRKSHGLGLLSPRQTWRTKVSKPEDE